MVYTLYMLLGSKPETKELIVHLLAEGALDTTDLQEKVQAKKSVTKQGFYKALRELVRDEVVVKNKQLAVLSNLWINKLQSFVTQVDEQYKQSSDFIALQEGENITYHFKTLESLDLFWMHQFFLIAKQFPNEPTIFYNSHEFWSLFRNTEQVLLYSWIRDHKRKTYFVIGGDSRLDKETTKHIFSYGLDMHYEANTGLKKNYYFTVIGEYIVATILDMNTTNAIDALYKKYDTWTEETQKELSIILGRLKRSKVVIERNKKKAEMLRKKLMKYFLFV
ncbi:MAG: hypothetical protein QG669_404 [Patescibacteria group bacterium]|nr:hypothetical protein [Patescibacteria group bacterium]